MAVMGSELYRQSCLHLAKNVMYGVKHIYVVHLLKNCKFKQFEGEITSCDYVSFKLQEHIALTLWYIYGNKANWVERCISAVLLH